MNVVSRISPNASSGAAAAATATAAVEQGVWSWPSEFLLHHGGSLPAVAIGWRLAGAVDAPVVAALGGISAHRRVFDAQSAGEGWWSEAVGPGRALDSTRLRVLGIDYLGASGESTGPVAGGAFPSLSSFDQAEALRGLMRHLSLQRLHAIVGASYGGMVALAFAARYSARVEQLLVISAADRAHPMATAWRCVQRRIVRAAVAAGRAEQGLELARALAMTTYRSPEEFAARFGQPPRIEAGRYVFPVEDYLFARGREFAARYRPESFLCLSESIDLHSVEAARIECLTTAVAVREDLLVPIGDMRALVSRLPRGQLREISSPYGHDAFLKEASQLQPIFESLYGAP